MPKEPTLFPDSASPDRPTARPPDRPAGPSVRPSDRPTALSVSQLLGELKGSVERAFGQLWVRGEVTSLKSVGNGAWFFTLRDNDNSIPCKMWKTYTEKMKEIPAEGTDVYVLATPSVWEKRGELHLRVVTLLPSARIGDHQLARERVRAALERDGLFALERKRALPAFPSTLAIVTSEDGAALHDIIVVARKRWPRIRLLVIAARVQGDGAPAELVRALGLVNRLKVDLCIVGRGGGAREDLLAFDDEKVCRAIAGLRVPSISAVGHETDISLADLVADVRAATPSAAIELALPDRHDRLRYVVSLGARLAHGLSRRTEVLTERLARNGDRMRTAMANRVVRPKARLERLAGQLDALSPLAVLARGYSVARLEGGEVVKRRAQLPGGTAFTLRVSDGEIPSRADS